ncbi:MAG: hypothetical protein JSR19_01405 [Proteobacteria bacterium]|nr:hypothetical protein [Pseudomonadota bacterium]HQR02506.1 hypothetical protein [Rhodocyclaceae bacterium]
MRLVRALLWFAAGFLMSAWAVSSYASVTIWSYQFGHAGTLSFPATVTSGYADAASAEAAADAAQTASKWVDGTTYTCVSTGAWSASGDYRSHQCSYNHTVSGYNGINDIAVQAYCGSGTSYSKGSCSGTQCTSTAIAAGPAYFTNPASLACASNGCFASFAMVNSPGSPTAQAIWGVDNGVAVYRVWGMYTYNGGGASDVCTQGALNQPAMPSPSANAPTDTCAAGQFKTTQNGKTVCVDASTNKAVPTGPQFVSGTSCTSVTNADNTITQTCVTQAPDGSTTSKATTYPANTPATAMQPASSSSTYTPGQMTDPKQSYCATNPSACGMGGGGGSSAPATNPATGQPQGSMGDYCAQNPTANGCKTTTQGTAATVQNLYNADGNGRSFSNSVTTFQNTIHGSAMYSATGGFFHGPSFSGSCSGLSTSFTLLHSSFSLDLTPYLCGDMAQGLYALLKAGILLAATVAAFSVAIL